MYSDLELHDKLHEINKVSPPNTVMFRHCKLQTHLIWHGQQIINVLKLHWEIQKLKECACCDDSHFRVGISNSYNISKFEDLICHAFG